MGNRDDPQHNTKLENLVFPNRAVRPGIIDLKDINVKDVISNKV